MKILSINSGSSSIKYRLFDCDQNYQLLAKGEAERIGQKDSFSDHRAAMHTLFPDEDNMLKQINAVGHRVVHGGDRFRDPTLINKEVIKEIKELAKFAPLHCQPNVTGVEVMQELLPHIPQVAIFDTAAHANIPPKAFIYGIPFEYYEKHHIRKYGFHGINHSYVAQEAAKLLNQQLENLKIVTCHLGNGCSISAFAEGKSIDNSMGLTPLEGLVMGSRSGDLDPAVVLYLNKEFGLQTNEIYDLLNKKSGLLGLCGKSDMRDVIEMAENGDTRAQTTIEIFVYRVQKYIGSYIAALDGVDVIVLTGGIGENSSYIRSKIMNNFTYIGAVVDETQNQSNKTIFSTNDSRTLLMNIPANEEIAIAKQTYQLLKGN